MIKPMLAYKYEGTNPTDWWMSEKLDGVRAIWDGENLRSRNDNIFQAPEWFIDDLPQNIYLDGELWLGRGKFQKVVGIVKSHRGNSCWKDVKYRIFDCAEATQRWTCEQRQLIIKALRLPAHASILRQIRCLNRKHLDSFHRHILELGGEGVMLRAFGSLYEQKRSKLLLKVKLLRGCITRVIGYQDGKGKYTGMIGALLCTWPGTIIEVGSGLSDADRTNPPAIGSMIKIEYYKITDLGVPCPAIFVGEIKNETI